MADELDDIFGAIDGDEEVVESEADEQIEEDDEDEDSDSMGEPEEDEEKDGDNDSTKKQGKQKMADTTTTRLYNSIMYAPTTTSNLRNEHTQQKGAASELMIPREAVLKKKEEEAEQHAATNAVNTGTSHDKSVRSYSSYPKNLPEGMELPKPKNVEKPAKEYPFKLDPFQAQAIQYIDKEESVLVAAHTSAGKTAVAEYAIAKSLNNGQRVVYTSPIKALSNQKFRELQEE